MIFGYVSRKPLKIDFILNNANSFYAYTFGSWKAEFYKTNTFCKPLYQDKKNLILCQGIPIKGSFKDGYEVVTHYENGKVRRLIDYQKMLNETISNVSMVFFTHDNREEFRLVLSSNRAAGGRIYYRYINSGVVFSSNFSFLMRLAAFKINLKAFYSIVKYGASPSPLTIASDIYSVPPAHFAVFTSSNLKGSLYPYYKFRFTEKHGSDLSRLEEILNAIGEFLGQLGCSLLLSGGVDSTLIAHKMHEHSRKQIYAYFLSWGTEDPDLTFAIEAAKSSNCKLQVFYFLDTEVLKSLIEASCTSLHPFNDFTFIPTYVLMKRIDESGQNQIVVDCSGADACFGFGTLAMASIWKSLFKVPCKIKQLLTKIYIYSDIWRTPSTLEMILRTVAKSLEKDPNLGPIVICPPNDVFIARPKYDKELGNLFTRLIDGLLFSIFNKSIFNQRATVADIIHLCGNLMTAKTLLSDDLSHIQTLYPFLWKDVLDEQGNLSWNCKVRKGIVKYPLKKLLERYVPSEFVHRSKSGFAPNSINYLIQKDFRPLYECLNSMDYIFSVINKKKWIDLLENLNRLSKPSISLANLLYGSLFTVLWLNNHYTTRRDIGMK